ncbi:MAG: thioredoxin family protein [Magnetovibrio sp.]|nr:thioredoxin family protein [Magnetovibrio sp.]
MNPKTVVDHDQWVEARKQLLAREKEFSRLRDELAAERRRLPWEKVGKDYVFHGPDGDETLAQLFAGRSQLIVYHFMLGPGWEEGCKACSYLADHFDPMIPHLAARDVSLVVASRAPLAELQAFRARMGWIFKWVSAAGNDFNWDYHVSFTPDAVERGEVYYNYATGPFPVGEGPGVSVFAREDGEVYHTYSAYARGLDALIGTYQFPDIAPKGRDEDALPFAMEWVRHHDRY